MADNSTDRIFPNLDGPNATEGHIKTGHPMSSLFEKRVQCFGYDRGEMKLLRIGTFSFV